MSDDETIFPHQKQVSLNHQSRMFMNTWENIMFASILRPVSWIHSKLSTILVDHSRIVLNKVSMLYHLIYSNTFPAFGISQPYPWDPHDKGNAHRYSRRGFDENRTEKERERVFPCSILKRWSWGASNLPASHSCASLGCMLETTLPLERATGKI